MTFDLSRRTHPVATNFRALTGQKFGDLSVLHFCGSQAATFGRPTPVWACSCECGSIVGVASSALLAGNTRSCGCRKKFNPGSKPTHGMSRSVEYIAWKAMKHRCCNPRSRAFDLYGGRGITVFPQWAASFEAFFDHIGFRPSPDHTLDRIDNDKGYEPGNVRWATWSEQNSNRSISRKYRREEAA